jgi:hypothetical protein
MFARNNTIFRPTADGFGSLTVRTPERVAATRRTNPALMAAGFLLSLALGLATLYQTDRALFAPLPHVAHGEIFAVDMD